MQNNDYLKYKKLKKQHLLYSITSLLSFASLAPTMSSTSTPVATRMSSPLPPFDEKEFDNEMHGIETRGMLTMPSLDEEFAALVVEPTATVHVNSRCVTPFVDYSSCDEVTVVDGDDEGVVVFFA